MKFSVGKRIKEIAGIIENIILIIAAIEGIFIILGGIILLCSDLGNFLISLVVIGTGVGLILLGKWVAEVSTIVTYGFGIIVDKMEHWNPEVRSMEPQKVNSAPSAARSNAFPVVPKTAVPSTQDSGGWTCRCGYRNSENDRECRACYSNRPSK